MLSKQLKFDSRQMLKFFALKSLFNLALDAGIYSAHTGRSSSLYYPANFAAG